MNQGSFADGTIPLSAEGIQSQIRLVRAEANKPMRRALLRNEKELDRLTLEMCKAERAEGKKLPEWLIKAEFAAFVRQQGRK